MSPNRPFLDFTTAALTVIDPGPPTPEEFGGHFGRYIGVVPPGPILVTLSAQAEETLEILQGVSAADAERKQPPYLWTFKDVVGHVTDAERIFAYRALRFARADPTPLPSFDENDYVRVARFDRRLLPELLAEFTAVRQATLALFRGFDPDVWLRRGPASGQMLSVRAIAYVIAGHERHHSKILRERVQTLSEPG